jgi:hypothetical protein
MADQTPQFDKATKFISEVQMDHAVSDDGKAMTITFANFTADIIPNGPPIAVRTFSLLLPLKNVANGARLKGAVQGSGGMEAGTTGMLVFRAGGYSLAFDKLFEAGENGFLKEINLPVTAGGDLRMTIVLSVEGSPADPKAQASANVSSVDLTIEPGDGKIKG